MVTEQAGQHLNASSIDCGIAPLDGQDLQLYLVAAYSFLAQKAAHGQQRQFGTSWSLSGSLPLDQRVDALPAKPNSCSVSDSPECTDSKHSCLLHQ